MTESAESKLPQFPMPTLADALCNACQLLDSVKADWQKEGCWSDWDQEVRDALSRELTKCYETKEVGAESKLSRERSGWFFERKVSHDRSREAVNRFCNSHYRRRGEKPQTSIPANSDDDDIVLVDYIAQQRAAVRDTREQCSQVAEKMGERSLKGSTYEHICRELAERLRGGI